MPTKWTEIPETTKWNDIPTSDETFDADIQAKVSDSLFYSGLSGDNPAEVYNYVDAINNQVYGKPDGSQINQGIVNEIMTDLNIGTLGLGIGLLGTIKKRGMQLSGMGIFPDEDIRHQWEVVKPPDKTKPEKGQQLPFINLFPMNRDIPLPGALVAESFALVSRLPDVGIKLMQEKSTKLQETLPPVTLKTAPITRLVRPVLQNVPQRAAAIGLGLLTGDAITALALLGETEGGNNFVTNLDRGDSLTKATFFSELDEVAEIGGEMLILPKVFKGLDEGLTVRQIANIAIENAGQEGATGFIQEFLQTYGTERGKGTSIHTALKLAVGNGLMAIPENAWVGGVMGGGEATAVSAVNAVSGMIASARARAEVEQQLGEEAPPEAVVEESELPTEMPNVTEQEFAEAVGIEIEPEEGQVEEEVTEQDIADEIDKIKQSVEAVVPPLDLPEKSIADKYEKGLHAGSILEGGEVKPGEGVWRSMGQKEFDRLLAGEELGGPEKVGKRAGWFSWFPARSAMEEGKPGKPKYLVEFADFQTEGEAVTQSVRRGDVTGVWISEGKGWTRYKPAPAAEAQQAERDILGGEDPITVLKVALTQAQEIIPVIKEEQKVARTERWGKVYQVAKRLIDEKGLTPSEALKIAVAQLVGPQTEYQSRYASIRDRLEQSSPGTVRALEMTVWESNKVGLATKNNIISALNKLIDGHYLTKGEIGYIRDFFGGELAVIAEKRVKVVPWWDQIVDVVRAGWLSGLKTTGLNLFSNASHAQTETMSDITAAGVDKFIAQFTKERTIAATVKGEVAGFKKGSREFVQYMKTGIDNREIAKKYDYIERNYGTGKFAKAREWYVNTIFHLMGAEDMLFYYAAEGRSYYNQALADGMNKGLKGQELKAHADKLALNPTEKMIEIGIRDAETAVFMNRTVLGDVASKFQEIPVVGKIIIPFSRTPSAIAMQVINYTPVGTAKEIIQQIHKGQFDQRKFSQAVGRSVVGTATIAIGYALFEAGLMTLAYPKGERERKLWELENRKPFSIKIGGKWRSIYVLGPAGNVLIVGGYLREAYERTGSPTEAITVAMAGGAKSIAEATFLRGLNQAIQAVTDPETSFNRWFSEMAGSMVPTLVADIARATDTTERRAEGPKQKIMNRLPLTREMLQPKLDVFGQDLPRYGGNPLEVMIDPTRPFKINQDMVVDELRRLWDNKIQVSPTLLGDRAGYDILTDEENTELWRMAGHMIYPSLFALIFSSHYRGLSDEDKGKEIEDLVKQAKDLARAEAAISKMSEGVTEIELRKGGLITSDVANMMKRLY